MPRIHLTFACGDYDRTRAIEDGSVQVDGVDLTYLRLPVEETFFRMLRHREFDVAEMSLSTYVATLNALEDGKEPPFVADAFCASRLGSSYDGTFGALAGRVPAADAVAALTEAAPYFP